MARSLHVRKQLSGARKSALAAPKVFWTVAASFDELRCTDSSNQRVGTSPTRVHSATMFGAPPGPLTARQRRHTSDNVSTPLNHVVRDFSQYDSHETQQACAVRALEEANRARAEQLKLLTETLSIMAHDDPLRDSVEAQRSRTLQEMGIYSSFSVVGPEAVRPAR